MKDRLTIPTRSPIEKQCDMYGCEICISREWYDQAVEILTEIENGTLIELPCKMGDKVYIVDMLRKQKHERKVRAFEVVDDGVNTLTDYGDIIRENDFIEKRDVFLTCEEAEARLKELQNK